MSIMFFAPLNNIDNDVTSAAHGRSSADNSLLHLAAPTSIINRSHLFGPPSTDILDSLSANAAAPMISSRTKKLVSSYSPCAPCGPVSGIRFAAGAAMAARSHTDISHIYPLNLLTSRSNAKANNSAGSLMVPVGGPSSILACVAEMPRHDHSNVFSFNIGPTAGSSTTTVVHTKGADPNSCGNMLDMLLDEVSYADLKEVPNLNVMHMSHPDLQQPAPKRPPGSYFGKNPDGHWRMSHII
ncbi:hypothetical protein L7F22_034050, partial [Adiantum nelumboides]|nr:hypothetical protein [Adiantum nelumboides]